MKPESYRYQSEYRLYCATADSSDSSIILNIGPIYDIAIIIDDPMFLVPVDKGKLEIRKMRL